MTRFQFLFLLTAVVATAATRAADTETRASSPYDRNPACMERTNDASSGNCVVPADGAPRHRHPPPAAGNAAKAAAATTAPGAATSPKGGAK